MPQMNAPSPDQSAAILARLLRMQAPAGPQRSARPPMPGEMDLGVVGPTRQTADDEQAIAEQELEMEELKQSTIDADPARAFQRRRNVQLADYEDPRSASIREDEFSKKLRMATDPARIAGQYRLAQTDAESRAQAEETKRLIAAGAQPGQRISVSGVGSISQANPARRQSVMPPASLRNKVLTASQAYRQAQESGGGMFGGLGKLFGYDPAAKAKAGYEAARDEYFRGFPQDLVGMVQEAESSFAPGMSVEAKLQMMGEMGLPDPGPEGIQMLRQILSAY